ncbi:hypothetical protein HMPREF0239_04384, partial [Clostridium sp. ATCC BAA-442]
MGSAVLRDTSVHRDKKISLPAESEADQSIFYRNRAGPMGRPCS